MQCGKREKKEKKSEGKNEGKSEGKMLVSGFVLYLFSLCYQCINSFLSFQCEVCVVS